MAAVGDGIGFEEAWARFIPLVGFDRDMFSDQGSRFSGRSATGFIFGSSRKQEAVDGGGRDIEEGISGLWRQRSKGLDITWEPEGQDDFEAFRAGEVGSEPDGL